MSDVTRQPGGSPAERAAQTPDARGESALGTPPAAGPHGTGTHGAGPADGTTAPAPGARADHGAGTRDDVTPGLRTDTTGAGSTPGPRTDATGATDSAAGARTEGAAGTRGLLPHEECDRLGQRLQHAVAEFVDAPRASVEEADRVLEELTARFTDAVTHRRRTLRTSWQDTGDETRATGTDTEQLRLALRDYRELADRLMHV
ncbi:hypothetical protein ACIRFH_08220 [Streptomyces sp. NPDC093586]|uniref:hypothetical protein n=1 Tax=Streptomyces sp. NPDC093586 TaxID=3366042 RepID=UPI0038033E8B